VAESYLRGLRDVPGINCFATPPDVTPNCSYFPILVGPNYPLSRDGLYEKLRERGIYSRRYFYPLISTMPMYRHLPSAAPANLPVATRISQQVLCLPIYPELRGEDVAKIVGTIADRS
jgi:dTDP-4-amino-4,6-dideoxygalactose transaminase